MQSTIGVVQNGVRAFQWPTQRRGTAHPSTHTALTDVRSVLIYGALTLENALQTPATKAPPAGGHFRPPAQPPDFSGVILFTNGEPVAMYVSS